MTEHRHKGDQCVLRDEAGAAKAQREWRHGQEMSWGGGLGSALQGLSRVFKKLRS